MYFRVKKVDKHRQINVKAHDVFGGVIILALRSLGNKEHREMGGWCGKQNWKMTLSPSVIQEKIIGHLQCANTTGHMGGKHYSCSHVGLYCNITP